MNYVDETYEVVIKIYSELDKETLAGVVDKIEDFIIDQPEMAEAAVTSLLIKEDAIR